MGLNLHRMNHQRCPVGAADREWWITRQLGERSESSKVEKALVGAWLETVVVTVEVVDLGEALNKAMSFVSSDPSGDKQRRRVSQS